MARASEVKKKSRVLITGATGGLAQIVVGLLARDYELVGVDTRPLSWRSRFPGKFLKIPYTHRKMAELFREEKFDSLIHLGRIRADSPMRADKRYDLNVLGTRNILSLGIKYGVKKFIVVSTYHVYGAHPHNHVHIRENAPLRAIQTFPELADAVELDHEATTFLWQNPQVITQVLRPVNVIGAKIRNSISTLLRSPYCPKLMGYDPLMQYIDEKDFARALQLCLKVDQSGVFNVSGEGVVPFSKSIRFAGGTPVSVPTFLIYPTIATMVKAGFFFPTHLLDYFRYPTVVMDEAFRNTFGYNPKESVIQSLKSLRSRTLY